MYESPYNGTRFLNLPINLNYPMSERYLERAHAVFCHALTQYPKVFMFHVTLRFPASYTIETRGVMSAFTRSVKERVLRGLNDRRRKGVRVHATDIHYVWCREVNSDLRVHYHIMFMVNANTYRALGSFNAYSKNHLAGIVCHAWASSIGLSINDSLGLVHFSGDTVVITTKQIPCARAESRYGSFNDSYESGFYWLSYLCKLDTKRYDGRGRNFGYSLY